MAAVSAAANSPEELTASSSSPKDRHRRSLSFEQGLPLVRAMVPSQQTKAVAAVGAVADGAAQAQARNLVEDVHF